jgi:hypothetical protein
LLRVCTFIGAALEGEARWSRILNDAPGEFERQVTAPAPVLQQQKACAQMYTTVSFSCFLVTSLALGHQFSPPCFLGNSLFCLRSSPIPPSCHSPHLLGEAAAAAAAVVVVV